MSADKSKREYAPGIVTGEYVPLDVNEFWEGYTRPGLRKPLAPLDLGKSQDHFLAGVGLKAGDDLGASGVRRARKIPLPASSSHLAVTGTSQMILPRWVALKVKGAPVF